MAAPPYAGPFYGPSDPQGRGADKSPYIEGVKRGISRAGYLTWTQFDRHYNRNLEGGIAAWRKDNDLPESPGAPGSGWGKASHDALAKAKRQGTNEPALDAVAVMLMEDGYALKHPPIVISPLDRVRRELADYLARCEDNRHRIHYQQRRPMTSLGDTPEGGFRGDCSELVVAACYWARVKSGVWVPDPSGYGYGGYGNSDSLYTVNKWRKIPFTGPFAVGDIAVYGPVWKTRHVSICRVPGDHANAVFTSHGSDAGPNPTRVYYRRSIYGGTWGDLLAVVRPVLVPS